MRTGVFHIDARMKQGEGGFGAGSLVLPTGERVPLGEHILTIGRLPECNIVLADPNVSRNHAEIRPRGAGYVVVDLGSTNGTKINGARVAEKELVDGDLLMFGNTQMRFEAS
jgi:pSer/pThr/pTyr-binding forkhead associated (FHA) protein